MSCYGCVGAIIKKLSSEDIKGVEIKFDEQLVLVKSERSSDDILGLIKGTGKNVIMV
jgi:copper chaperone CopZ